MTTDYKATVFLPRTDFPMRGNLPEREPEMLARFRLGVRTSASVPKLLWELRILLLLVRENLPALRNVGVDDAFVARGEEVFRRLEETHRKMADELAVLPPQLLELYHAQGVLYTRARFLRRMGEIALVSDPIRQKDYTYEAIRPRPEEVRGSRPRAVGVSAQGR